MRSRSGCQLTEKRSEFASIQLKPNENSGQGRLRLNQTSKKAPPLCEILATRLFPAIQTIIVIFNFMLSFLTPHVALFSDTVLFVICRGQRWSQGHNVRSLGQ